MVQFTRIVIAAALTVSCLSCSSWALSVPATTSATTCISQLRELATQLDDAFTRVFDDVAEIATSIFSPTATPPTGGTSTLPVASNPTSSSGPTPRTLATPTPFRPFRPFRPVRPIHPFHPFRPFRPLSLGRRSPTAPSQHRTLRSLYQNLTRARGEAPSDAVYDHFVSAMSDVSQEHFKACYGPSSERVRPTHVQSLIRQFNGLRNTARVHELRAVFANLICIRDQNSRIGKRSTGDLEEFFRGLSSRDFGDIFGFTEINQHNFPTGSLAFAVDTTGSMGDEIRKVQDIIRSFIQSEKQEPFYYVLAEFNDYDGERLASTQCDLERDGRLATAYSSRNATDLNNLTTAVRNLRAHGGGDCHEYGMAGILKCLHTRVPNYPIYALGHGSHIVVLTDAGSKDRKECMDRAIAEAQAKGIPVHFFLSSTGCLSPSTAATYKQVAAETGGVVVENTLDFEALTIFIHRLTELQRRADSGPYHNRGRGKRSISSSEQRCHTFRASAFTTSLDLLFNTTSTTITVRKPDNHVVTLTKRNAAEKLKYFSQIDPQPGAWTACVSSPGTLSVSTAMPTDVKFIGSFLKEGKDAAGNTKYYLASRVPYACSMGTVVVRVLEGQITNISTSHPLYLDFLDADKNVLQEISVTACNGLFRGEATYPASTDFLRLRGTDVYGVPFSYIRPAIDAPVIFRPSRFSLTSTSGSVVSISTGSTHTLTYQLQAVETEGSTSFNFSLQTSTSGFDTNVSPAQAVISANQSVTVSVQVTPTSHVPAGNHQITLSATSGCDTLSAVQSVTINTMTAPTPASDECGGCQNGGTCFSIPWGTRVIRRCGCTPGYAGTYCEIAF